MALKLPARLMSDARRVKVPNSGLEVWLYDRSFRDALKASGAFETDVEPASFEKAMQGFVRAGRIMAYSLMQDDGVDVAVAVRKPLAASELGTVPWRETQQAFLRLPTGRLVIESNDSLTLRKLKPTDRGAEIEVPAGDYLATLHRVDWDVLADDDAEWKGPSEFITLTGGAAAKPVRGQPAVLPWEAPEPAGAAWKIADGAYTGAAIFHDDETGMSIAIDAKGIAELGLADRSVTLLAVPDLGFECALVWVKGDRMQGAYYDRLERLHPPAACAGKQWALCNLALESEDPSVFCLRRASTTKVPRKKLNQWYPATMRVLEARALEKK